MATPYIQPHNRFALQAENLYKLYATQWKFVKLGGTHVVRAMEAMEAKGQTVTPSTLKACSGMFFKDDIIELCSRMETVGSLKASQLNSYATKLRFRRNLRLHLDADDIPEDVLHPSRRM